MQSDPFTGQRGVWIPLLCPAKLIIPIPRGSVVTGHLVWKTIVSLPHGCITPSRPHTSPPSQPFRPHLPSHPPPAASHAHLRVFFKGAPWAWNGSILGHFLLQQSHRSISLHYTYLHTLYRSIRALHPSHIYSATSQVQGASQVDKTAPH